MLYKLRLQYYFGNWIHSPRNRTGDTNYIQKKKEKRKKKQQKLGTIALSTSRNNLTSKILDKLRPFQGHQCRN